MLLNSHWLSAPSAPMLLTPPPGELHTNATALPQTASTEILFWLTKTSLLIPHLAAASTSREEIPAIAAFRSLLMPSLFALLPIKLKNAFARTLPL